MGLQSSYADWYVAASVLHVDLVELTSYWEYSLLDQMLRGKGHILWVEGCVEVASDQVGVGDAHVDSEGDDVSWRIKVFVLDDRIVIIR